MTIEKRKIAKIILLNCLTLGIYGAITYQKLGNEINSLFEGDGEEPKVGFMGAVLIGLICPIYRLYWWYRQAGRIKLNAGRYNLVVREKGVDALLFRTIGEIPMAMATVVSLFLHILLPALFIGLIYMISEGVAIVIGVVFVIALALFLPDCTAGAYVSIYFVIKNINRFADAGESNYAFDPMAYEYEPTIQDKFVKFVPGLIDDEVISANTEAEITTKAASLEATRGSNKGYSFELIPGEEVIIGRNPAEANVVIDSNYDQVSGRHVGILYEAEYDSFCVVDYSKNGTYVDGQKLINGKQYRFGRGARIELVDGKNAFRLK